MMIAGGVVGGFILLAVICVIIAKAGECGQQRSPSPIVTSNSRTVRYARQQRPERETTRNAYVSPLYSISLAPPIASTHEAKPPSYETTTVNLPPLYSLALQPPVTAMVEQTDSSV